MANVKKGHKKTELCEIPEEWEVIKLDKIFDFYGGQPIPRRQLNDDGVAYLHYGDIHTLNRSYIDIRHDTNWLPKLNTEQKINEDSLLYEGDIVFVDASEDYEGIGKSVVIYNQGKIPFVAGLHTIIAKEKSKKLNDNFKRYCFSTRAVRQQFRMLATGATVYGISKTNIKSIIIAVPPLPEQKKIAEILSTVDELIEQTDALIEKTKELKNGLMQQLLTRGIGHTRFKKTELGEIPEEWEVCKFGEVLELEYGFSLPEKDRKEGPFPVYGSNGIVGYHDKYFVRAPGIILGRKGSIDKVRYSEINFCPIDTTYYVNNKKHCEWKWLFYLISIQDIRSLNAATGVPSLNRKDFYTLKAAIPPIEEQRQIATIINEVDVQIDKYNNKKNILLVLKQGLMQKLLTGQIRVKV